MQKYQIFRKYIQFMQLIKYVSRETLTPKK